MPAANLTTPRDIQAGNFNAIAYFLRSVTDFGTANVSITAQSGNGTTGVTYAINETMGAYYNIAFTLPVGVAGSFEISLTGNVMINGTAEAITARQNGTITAVVSYDTINAVSATFGTLRYLNSGEIIVPINFTNHDSIQHFDRTDCELVCLTCTDPDDLINNIYDFDYYLNHTDLNAGNSMDQYELYIVPAPGRKGELSVDITGVISVLGNRLNVDVTPIRIRYDSFKPFIIDQLIPLITAGFYDVYIDFSRDGIGLSVLELIIQGVAFDPPTIYRSNSALNMRPALAERPDTVPDSQEDFADILGTTTTPYDMTNSDTAVWTKVPEAGNITPARYFLLRHLVGDDQTAGRYRLYINENAFYSPSS